MPTDTPPKSPTVFIDTSALVEAFRERSTSDRQPIVREFEVYFHSAVRDRIAAFLERGKADARRDDEGDESPKTESGRR